MAVYTQLTNEAIAELLEQEYGLAPLAFAVGITQGVTNSNYLVAITVRKEEQKYILTLYEKRMKEQDLPFFLNLMQHVAGRGLACPQPVARKDGALWGKVGGKPAALVSFLEGKSRSILRNNHVAAAGRAMAELQLAAKDFNGRRENALSLSGWQEMHAKLQGKLDGIEKGLEALVGQELGYLEKHWPRDLPKGVVHADLFPDNVFFVGDKMSGIIDFYFACEDFLAYDVAVTLNAWCFEKDHAFNAGKAKLLIENYQQLRPFSAAEKAAFPILLRGAAMRFLLTRAYDLVHHDAGALVVPHDPREYVAKLKFHQQHKGSLA